MLQTILTILAGVAQALPKLLELLERWVDAREERDLARDLEECDRALAEDDVLALGRLLRELPD